MNEVYYGIETGQIPDFIEDKRDFARCLFFSQGLTSSDVYFILQVLPKLKIDEILGIYHTLKNEVQELSKLRNLIMSQIKLDACKEIYDKTKTHSTPLEKFMSWEYYLLINHFCTSKEKQRQ